MNARRTVLFLFVLVIAAIAMLACRNSPPVAAKPQLGWRPIDKWAGQGSTQTDSFNIESTLWRIKWDVKNGTVSAPLSDSNQAILKPAPEIGTFHVAVHSAVSGRFLMDAVQQHGAGHGIAYVTEDPRLYHLVVESNGLDWAIAVEEGVSGTP